MQDEKNKAEVEFQTGAFWLRKRKDKRKAKMARNFSKLAKTQIQTKNSTNFKTFDFLGYFT